MRQLLSVVVHDYVIGLDRHPDADALDERQFRRRRTKVALGLVILGAVLLDRLRRASGQRWSLRKEP